MDTASLALTDQSTAVGTERVVSTVAGNCPSLPKRAEHVPQQACIRYLQPMSRLSTPSKAGQRRVHSGGDSLVRLGFTARVRVLGNTEELLV